MSRLILVTGGSGQVGRSLTELDWPDDVHLLVPTRRELDISKRTSVDAYFATHRLDAIINCSAYTAVERAETDIAEAYAINAFGPAWLAAGARRADIPILHLSTDYVFAGMSDRPREPDDPPAPTSVYGASKLAGEIAVLAASERAIVVRTCWLFSPHRSNFLKTMLGLAVERSEIDVVDDQRATPTSAPDLAVALRTIVLRAMDDDATPHGIFHYANDGEASWAEFAEEIMAHAARAGLPTAAIRQVSSDAFPTSVERPADSRLSIERLRQSFGTDHPNWRNSTRAVVDRLAAEWRRKQER